MSNIKTKDMKPKTVKTLDKAVAWTERVKDPIVYANEKAKDVTDGQVDVLDYGEDKIKYVSNLYELCYNLNYKFKAVV